MLCDHHFKMENVRPVTPDAEAMEAISRAIEERAQIVAATQAELLEAQRNQDILDEQEFYAEVTAFEKFSLLPVTESVTVVLR